MCFILKFSSSKCVYIKSVPLLLTQVSSNFVSFGTAESECLLDYPNWMHQGHMFFSTSRKVLDKVAELVKAKSTAAGQTQQEYWLGIDDRDKDGKWVDR